MTNNNDVLSNDEQNILRPESCDPMKILDFLYESNLIERVEGDMALQDSLMAWNYAYQHRHKITLEYILETHRLLLQNLEPGIAGKLRDCDVWIGGELKPFVCYGLLKSDVEDWIKDTKVASRIKRRVEKSKETLAKKWHVEFENIHPFADGNGRSGRILFNIHRVLLGLPIITIESKTKYENYYPWFKKQI